jgi:hypothetical protein
MLPWFPVERAGYGFSLCETCATDVRIHIINPINMINQILKKDNNFRIINFNAQEYIAGFVSILEN